MDTGDALAAQLLMLYYILLYEDVRRSNTSNTPHRYSADLLSELPLKFLSKTGSEDTPEVQEHMRGWWSGSRDQSYVRDASERISGMGLGKRRVLGQTLGEGRGWANAKDFGGRCGKRDTVWDCSYDKRELFYEYRELVM